MRLRITIPVTADESVRQSVIEGADKVEDEHVTEQDWQAVSLTSSSCRQSNSLKVILVDPSLFKSLNELLSKEVKGKARIETLIFAPTTSK